MTTPAQSLEGMEVDYASEMALPAEKTCSDCRHAKRCIGFGFTTAERTSCDFYPNRFRAALSHTPDKGEGQE